MEEIKAGNTPKRKGLMQSVPDFINRNIWLLLEILACVIFYIGNR